ncbi:GNAT family N-acetyltransferase [Catenulispora sp. NF23]|uniref:GNAT family N-acetyltransferase n=1 Tax=Catenulispora pinistramenti TaxID=2705254 RepID=UPI001BA9ADA0|nr:GNAT family N-acetyltransferase [Catenulispora pinistramenti]MBS2536949.1 GNAT family N-acetyltransferase [Catenulispora pinistramenti]
MPLTIRELRVEDPATVPELLALYRDAVAADAPRYPEPTESLLRWLMVPRVARHRSCVVAYDGDRPVGYGCMNHDNKTNRDLISGNLWIRPEDRAEVAVPLIGAFKAYARGRGCTRLTLPFGDHSTDYEAVFTAEGGRPVAREFRMQVDLTAIDRERYADLAQPSEKNAHYRIEQWRSPTPEHLLPAVVQANEAMRDAPTGDLDFQFAPASIDRRRQMELDAMAVGTRLHIIAALTADATIAGFHEVLLFPGCRMADVGRTAVPTKFRGHGLGLRLKAALTLHLLEHEPQIDTVSTWNDSDNVPMLRVNGALGYERAEAWSNWQFDL